MCAMNLLEAMRHDSACPGPGHTLTMTRLEVITGGVPVTVGDDGAPLEPSPGDGGGDGDGD